MKKKLEPIISSVILIVLPIGALYLEVLSHMYLAVTIGLTLLFIYVTYLNVEDRLNKEAPLSKALMTANIWNVIFCILVGWWWSMVAWLYISMVYFGVRGQKNKNDVKGE